jgi:predicted P-loop ATPase
MASEEVGGLTKAFLFCIFAVEKLIYRSMKFAEIVKGLFHSSPSVSSPSGQMTESIAQNAVPVFVQSVLKDVCVAIMNNQQVSGSPLSKEELEGMLTRVASVISASYQQALSNTAASGDRTSSKVASKVSSTEDEAPLKITRPEKSQESSSHRAKDLMDRLMAFLRAHYHFQYNVLTRETEMRNLEVPSAQYVVVTKREENTLVLEAQAEGIDCWNADVNRIIHCSKVDEYHPFIQYFDRLPKWDGVDRVTPLAQRISDNKVWVEFGCHRWMLAMVAQWMYHVSANDRANCVAPLLISEKQGQGKSTACRMLLPTELQRYYTESFDLSTPSACEAKLADAGLINLDEFDKFTAKKMPLLKNLMQEKALNIKRAYATTSTPLHRIASFIGTSNRHDLLVDKTGSRRFICLEVNDMIDCETPIEYEQLYAQLKAEILQGERTYFNKEEEAKIQENNRPYYRSSVEEEAFFRHFRFADKGEEGAVFMNATDIFKALKKEEGSVLRGVTPHAFCRLLPTLGKRVHTKWANGYYVVKFSSSQTISA